ncbi:MAG: hypothetical protein ACYTBJ_20205 [Planctomycetota bacterium]|jgi:hypothetical protein
MDATDQDLYKLVSKTQSDVAYLRGYLKSEIPRLASKDKVENDILKHENKFHKKKSYSDVPPPYKSRGRTAAKIGVGTTGLGAIVFGVIRLIQWLASVG